jgi:hypothetical protein
MLLAPLPLEVALALGFGFAGTGDAVRFTRPFSQLVRLFE